MFATDRQGHLYIHETTRDGIRKLREQLLRAQPFPVARPAAIKPEYAFGGRAASE